MKPRAEPRSSVRFPAQNPTRGKPFTSESARAAQAILSEARSEASRLNGARGGRPRKKRRGYIAPASSVEWETPPDLFRALDAEFSFTLDPCATAANAKCSRFYTRTDDGLMQPWAPERVFLNPPYGPELARWIAKAYAEAQRGALVVALIPARTDTRWWHQYVTSAEVHFLPGRICYGGYGQAPFPSAVVIFRPSHDRSERQ